MSDTAGKHSAPGRDRTRDRIRAALEAAGDRGLTTTDVAHRVGIHPNSARDHLARMTAQGLTMQTDDRTGGVGRPRRRHILVTDPGAPTSAPLDIATIDMLAALLNCADIDDDSAVAAGRALAQHRAAQCDHDDALTALIVDQTRLGFAPHVDHDTTTTCITFEACPLRAATTTSSVCSLHRGLLDGWLDPRRDQTTSHRLTTLVVDSGDAPCHALVTAH